MVDAGAETVRMLEALEDRLAADAAQAQDFAALRCSLQRSPKQ